MQYIRQGQVVQLCIIANIWHGICAFLSTLQRKLAYSAKTYEFSSYHVQYVSLRYIYFVFSYCLGDHLGDQFNYCLFVNDSACPNV